MSDTTAEACRRAMTDEFASLRRLAERALAQVDDDAFFRRTDDGANAIAALVKHVGGNLRSRWSDIFTTDGEKPDRDRDGEFEPGEPRQTIERIWADGWTVLEHTLSQLTDDDLARTIYIRGEAHTVVRALTRSLAHTAGHVHQIVLLAKQWKGAAWQTLSIPRGMSRQFQPSREATR